MFCQEIFDLYYFIFTDSISRLVYYSHIPAMAVALFAGFFVFLKTKNLAGKLLLAVMVSFSLWVSIDLILWTSSHSGIISFFWSLLGLVYAVMSLLFFYFGYVFSFEKDMPFSLKMVLLFLLLPLVLLLPSTFNIRGVDLFSCESEEGFLYTMYYYGIGFIAFFMTLFLLFTYKRRVAKENRKKVMYVLLGISFFLLTFFFFGVLSSYFYNLGFSSTFYFEQFGLFGMIFFIVLLAYLMVKHHIFQIKLLSAQVLIISLAFLIASQYFYIRTWQNYILTSITLILVIVGGVILVRVIKRDMERKNELQIMADKLAQANQRLKKLDQAKSEFISIASHQLRTPLTAIKGFISLILEGSYGNIDAPVRSALNKVYLSNERLIQLVEDLLSISRIESGRLEYKFRYWNIEEIVKDVVDMFRLRAREKGLDLELELPEHKLPEIYIDGEKIREVISNLIDNATKYTKRGYVRVRVEEKGENVQIIIQDSGIGIIAEDIPYLFEKFSRGKDTNRLHANGTGLGLYVGKQIVKAHKGGLYAFSEGEDKGSSFVIELLIKKEKEGEKEKGEKEEKEDDGEGLHEREE